MDVIINQEVLKDISSTGIDKPWIPKKIKTESLAESYMRIGLEKKSYRVKNCGTFLSYKEYLTTNQPRKLIAANFCKVRLCPMCGWRRANKIYGQVSKIMNSLLENKNYRFLFLTLTVKNCSSQNLSCQLDDLFYGFKMLMKRKNVKTSVKGWFRALEITHNLNIESKSYDTYHPHFHVILVVDNYYFTSKNYIKHSEWCDMWQKAMSLDYKPNLHIKSFKDDAKNSVKKSVAEAAKYTIKDVDYLTLDNDMTDSAVATLDRVLLRRRLVAFGGVMKDVHKKLNLDDPVEGDLGRTDKIEEELREDIDYVIKNYHWDFGYKQYLRI